MTVDNVAAAFAMTNAILAEGESRPTDACPRTPPFGIDAKVGVPIAITTRYEFSLAIHQPSAFFPMNNLANKRKFEILGTVGSSQRLTLVGQLKVGSVGWGQTGNMVR